MHISYGGEYMTIDELKKICDQEFKNIDRIETEIFSIYKSEKSEYTLAEEAALGAFVINVYSGIENILKQTLLFDKLDVSDAPGWHEKVLKKAGELGILPPDIFQLLSKYLSFRNYFIYNYVFNIKWEDMQALVEAIREVTKRVRQEVEEYLQTI